MTQYELMEKIIEKLNEGGIYNALQLADIYLTFLLKKLLLLAEYL